MFLFDLAGKIRLYSVSSSSQTSHRLQSEIVVAFAKAREASGRVDVVFNNAGGDAYGELEPVKKEARARSCIYVWGAAQASREGLGFFNQSRGGRVLHISSGAPRLVSPCSPCYCRSSQISFKISSDRRTRNLFSRV
ncbi:hypothetical protein HD554DRAFT_1765479 [Boletus coccyginus]|nr:hypothetical protein HD554DRAFT_1765479 [Boletus coccyginus]